ncbi:MAG: hypothetical protein Q8O11_01890, partial [Syntrophales bacterium]|nr:hypothetical protein [Syntrophales bacterium]
QNRPEILPVPVSKRTHLNLNRPLSETGGIAWRRHDPSKTQASKWRIDLSARGRLQLKKRFFQGSKIFLDIFARLDIEQTQNDMTFGQIVTAVHNRRRLLRCSEFIPWFEDIPQRQSWRSHKKSIFPRESVFASRSGQGRVFDSSGRNP